MDFFLFVCLFPLKQLIVVPSIKFKSSSSSNILHLHNYDKYKIYSFKKKKTNYEKIISFFSFFFFSLLLECFANPTHQPALPFHPGWAKADPNPGRLNFFKLLLTLRHQAACHSKESAVCALPHPWPRSCSCDWQKRERERVYTIHPSLPLRQHVQFCSLVSQYGCLWCCQDRWRLVVTKIGELMHNRILI